MARFPFVASIFSCYGQHVRGVLYLFLIKGIQKSYLFCHGAQKSKRLVLGAEFSHINLVEYRVCLM